MASKFYQSAVAALLAVGIGAHARSMRNHLARADAGHINYMPASAYDTDEALKPADEHKLFGMWRSDFINMVFFLCLCVIAMVLAALCQWRCRAWSRIQYEEAVAKDRELRAEYQQVLYNREKNPVTDKETLQRWKGELEAARKAGQEGIVFTEKTQTLPIKKTPFLFTRKRDEYITARQAKAAKKANAERAAKAERVAQAARNARAARAKIFGRDIQKPSSAPRTAPEDE